MSICRTCSVELTQDNWYPSCQRANQYRCIDCTREYYKRYRADNPEKEKARNKKYYETHSEEILARQREWYANNPEKRRAQARKYYLTRDKATEAARMRKLRADNRQKMREYQREYMRRYFLNPEQREKRNARARAKRSSLDTEQK